MVGILKKLRETDPWLVDWAGFVGGFAITKLYQCWREWIVHCCSVCYARKRGRVHWQQSQQKRGWHGACPERSVLRPLLWIPGHGGRPRANGLVHCVSLEQAPGEGICQDISVRLHLPCWESSPHYVLLWLHNLRNSNGPTEESPGRVKAGPSSNEVSGYSQGWNPLQIWMRPPCDGWEASTLHILTSPQVATHLIAETKQLLLKSTPSSS